MLLAGCTTLRGEDGATPDEVLYASGQQVSACNLRAHLTCIYLTAAETIADGRRAKFTRHWFRMSYIGRACQAQHGTTTGIILESLFAVPHYAGLAIGNTLSLLLYPFEPAQADESKPDGEL